MIITEDEITVKVSTGSVVVDGRYTNPIVTTTTMRASVQPDNKTYYYQTHRDRRLEGRDLSGIIQIFLKVNSPQQQVFGDTDTTVTWQGVDYEVFKTGLWRNHFKASAIRIE